MSSGILWNGIPSVFPPGILSLVVTEFRIIPAEFRGSEFHDSEFRGKFTKFRLTFLMEFIRVYGVLTPVQELRPFRSPPDFLYGIMDTISRALAIEF